MNKKTKIIIAIVVVVVICGFVGFAIFNYQNALSKSGIPRNAKPVQVEAVHKETIITKVTAKGKVNLIDKTVVYPTTQEKIKTIPVKVGDVVAAGAVLIEYDNESLKNYQDQLADAKLALKSAELGVQSARLPASESEKLQATIQISQAEKGIKEINSQIEQFDVSIQQFNNKILEAQDKYKTQKKLFDQGVISKFELDSASEAVTQLEYQLETVESQRNASLKSLDSATEGLALAQEQYNTTVNKQNDKLVQNKIDQLQVSVEQAQLKIQQLEKKINDFKQQEIAETTGTVLNIAVREGDVAVAGKPLMEIADVSNKNLNIKVNVPENKASNLQIGQIAEITGEALGTEIYMGKTSKINPQAEEQQVGTSMETVLIVEVVPADDSAPLRAGYTVETAIITGTAEDVTVVPIMSTASESAGVNYVFIAKDDYTAEKRYITLGQYSGLYVQAEGVTEGEKVILDPTSLTDGAAINPKETTEG